MGLAAGGTLYVGLGADGPWLPEALFLLLCVANRRPGASTARRRSRDPRDRRAAPSRIPVHRARRRQLLSGDICRSGAGEATCRWRLAARAGSLARRAI